MSDDRPEIRLRPAKGGWRFTARTLNGHDVDGWHVTADEAALQALHVLGAHGGIETAGPRREAEGGAPNPKQVPGV